MSNPKTGLDNIKEQWFSLDRTANRITFALVSLATLPIIFFCLFIIDELLWQWDLKDYSVEYNISFFFLFSILIFLVVRILFTFIIRRLRDLNLDNHINIIYALGMLNLLFVMIILSRHFNGVVSVSTTNPFRIIGSLAGFFDAVLFLLLLFAKGIEQDSTNS